MIPTRSQITRPTPNIPHGLGTLSPGPLRTAIVKSAHFAAISPVTRSLRLPTAAPLEAGTLVLQSVTMAWQYNV
jgi:hypothetical protein